MSPFRIAFYAVCAVILPLIARAQDSVRVIILSPMVGQVLERAERDKYMLFRTIPDFQSGLFFLHGGRCYGKIERSDGRRDTLIEYREQVLRQIAERITNHDALVAGTHTMDGTAAALQLGTSVSAAELGIDVGRLRAMTPLALGTPIGANALSHAIADSSKTVLVRLRNGSVLKGRVSVIDSATWTVLVQGVGIVKTPVSEILALQIDDTDDIPLPARAVSSDTAARVFPASKGSEYGYGDPSSFRGFLLPTAYTVRSGTTYLAFDEFCLTSVGIGVSDQVTLTTGTFLVPGLFSEGLVLHFGFKAQLVDPSDGFAFALGASGLTAIGGQDAIPLLPFVVITTGDADVNLSMIGSYATLGKDGRGSELLGLCGQLRLSEGLKVMADLGYIPGRGHVPMVLGFRFFGHRTSGDIGILSSPDDDIAWMPFFNFSYYF